MHEDDPFEPATLVIACEGFAALHVQHETGEIIGRVNAFLGFNAIGRIRIVQKPVTPRRGQAEAAAAAADGSREGKTRRGRSAAIEDDGAARLARAARRARFVGDEVEAR